MSCTKHLSRIGRRGIVLSRRLRRPDLRVLETIPYPYAVPFKIVGLLTFRWRQLVTGLWPGAEHAETVEIVIVFRSGTGAPIKAYGLPGHRHIDRFALDGAPLIFHGRGQARPTRLQLGFRLLPSPPAHATFRNLSLLNGSLFFSM
jgi:hypothetical protein